MSLRTPRRTKMFVVRASARQSVEVRGPYPTPELGAPTSPSAMPSE